MDIMLDVATLPLAPAVSAADNDADMSSDADAADFRPSFKPLTGAAATTVHHRKILIPPNRVTPLRRDWPQLYAPIVEQLQLQIRYDTKTHHVHVRSSKATAEVGGVQRASDFIRAWVLGFSVEDAVALLRLDELYVDSFEIKDVKTLEGDHLARAIGRIAGKDGKTRFAIENASRTRIVLADTKIHILGTVQNIKVARTAIVSLILGSPPGKVYANLRTVTSRMKEAF